jgi:hypothetical protein
LVARRMPDCPAKLKLQVKKDSEEKEVTLEQVRNAYFVTQQNISEVMSLLNALFCSII